jgi:hypothetical protein
MMCPRGMRKAGHSSMLRRQPRLLPSRFMHNWGLDTTGVRKGTSEGHGWVEGGRDNGKPGRTGRQPRCVVAGVLGCIVGALETTTRDLKSHWFTLSLHKRFSRDRRYQSPIQLTMDDCMITSDTPTHPCGKLSPGSDISERLLSILTSRSLLMIRNGQFLIRSIRSRI